MILTRRASCRNAGPLSCLPTSTVGQPPSLGTPTSTTLRGGMGQVALFHDANVERQLAIKSLLPELVDSEDHVAEFVAEARVIGRLEHPNIVPLYDLGVRQSGELYFTMQYVKGRALSEVVASLKSGNVTDHRHFTWARRAQIIQQVCDGWRTHTIAALHIAT